MDTTTLTPSAQPELLQSHLGSRTKVQVQADGQQSLSWAREADLSPGAGQAVCLESPLLLVLQ